MRPIKPSPCIDIHRDTIAQFRSGKCFGTPFTYCRIGRAGWPRDWRVGPVGPGQYCGPGTPTLDPRMLSAEAERRERGRQAAIEAAFQLMASTRDQAAKQIAWQLRTYAEALRGG